LPAAAKGFEGAILREECAIASFVRTNRPFRATKRVILGTNRKPAHRRPSPAIFGLATASMLGLASGEFCA